MKALKLALCAAAASFAMAGAASAQNVSFNLAATSDYVFRGYSQTDEGPAIQGGVDFTQGVVYGGLWASNVDFLDSTDAEIDAYFGIKPTAGAVTFDFGAVYYGYINAPSAASYDYWEFKGAASVPVGPATAGVAVFYSPAFFGDIGDAVYYEVNGSVSPVDKWTVSGALGEQTFDDVTGDYTTWNLGVGYALTGMVSADLRYYDTDVDTPIADERVVLTLKAVM